MYILCVNLVYHVLARAGVSQLVIEIAKLIYFHSFHIIILSSQFLRANSCKSVLALQTSSQLVLGDIR